MCCLTVLAWLSPPARSWRWPPQLSQLKSPPAATPKELVPWGTVTTKDGTQIYYRQIPQRNRHDRPIDACNFSTYQYTAESAPQSSRFHYLQRYHLSMVPLPVCRHGNYNNLHRS